MKEIDRIINLLKKQLKHQQKYPKDKEISALIHRYPFLTKLFKELKTDEGLKKSIEEYGRLSDCRGEQSEARMWNRVVQEVRKTKENEFRRTIPLWKYVSAACILIIASVGIWKLQTNHANTTAQFIELRTEFSPGSNKAVLQLANGKLIELSSEHQSLIVGENLSYNDGTLLLDNFGNQELDFLISTPKGGQYQIILSDGTHVWMNADSKLFYPKKFEGSIREVRLDGEAYFEVAENKEKPFVVKTENERVVVLGTHFNVNAYKEESTSRVSLIEGSVKVVLPNNYSKVLHPGQQTLVEENQLSVQIINLDEVIAWKKGEFMFNDENLESVMRKLARWYDLDIEVSPSLKDISIWGSISRYDNFINVLKIIKMTDNQIKIKVDGRRVRIMK